MLYVDRAKHTFHLTERQIDVSRSIININMSLEINRMYIIEEKRIYKETSDNNTNN